jgi:hypothetical protein
MVHAGTCASLQLFQGLVHFTGVPPSCVPVAPVLVPPAPQPGPHLEPQQQNEKAAFDERCLMHSPMFYIMAPVTFENVVFRLVPIPCTEASIRALSVRPCEREPFVRGATRRCRHRSPFKNPLSTGVLGPRNSLRFQQGTIRVVSWSPHPHESGTMSQNEPVENAIRQIDAYINEASSQPSTNAQQLSPSLRLQALRQQKIGSFTPLLDFQNEQQPVQEVTTPLLPNEF